MGIFAELKKAKSSGGGRQYLKPGTHRVSINSVKFDKSRPPGNVEYFAVGVRLLATTGTDMEVGESYDWSTHADKDAYFGNIKQFICAVVGLNEQAFDALSDVDGEAVVKAVSGPDQKLTGKVVEAVCIDQISKAGKTYTATRWQPAQVDAVAGAGAVAGNGATAAA